MHISEKLQFAKLTTLSSGNCEDLYHEHETCVNKTNEDTVEQICRHQRFLKEYEICVKPGNQDACKGDSGGPLVCKGKNICENKNMICLQSFIVLTSRLKEKINSSG